MVAKEKESEIVSQRKIKKIFGQNSQFRVELVAEQPAPRKTDGAQQRLVCDPYSHAHRRFVKKLPADFFQAVNREVLDLPLLFPRPGIAPVNGA
jgi:hypothetical protein